HAVWVPAQRSLRSLGRDDRESKLSVQAAREDRDRATIGVVGGIDDVLIVEGQGAPARELQRVVGLENPLRAVVQPAVADQEAEAARSQEVAVRLREPVHRAADADRVVRPPPETALDRETAGE